MATEAMRAGRGRVLVGLVLTMGLAAIDTTIVATAIPSIVRELGGFSLFTWVFSIYVLAQAVTIPVYGKLADLLGRKPVLIAGTLLFLIGSVLSGLSWSMVALIVFRGIQGLGAGAIQPVVTTVAGDLYTVEERARIQGWLSSVWGISAVIGPAVGGLFSEYISWRWIFYINIPLGAAALFMIVRFLHEDVVRKKHRIDYGGAALLATAAGLFIFGLLQGGVHWAWTSAAGIGVFVGAVVALVAFALRERRAAEPMLPPWIVQRRVLVGANLASATLGLLSIGLTTFLPTYAQGVLGVGAVAAGFILAVMSITWPLSSALSGRLYLRIGFRDTALIGMGIALCAALFFVALPRSVPAWTPAIGSLIMGAGLGLMATPLIVGVQSVVEWERRGVVTGANLFARQLGQSVGAALYGSVANAALAAWFHHAPATVARELPQSVNAANSVLGNSGSTLDAAAIDYVRQGLYVATHRVFVGLAIIAVAGIAILLLTPRQFARLTFAEEERAERRTVPAPAD
jgi:EmrB/QacA subfamily drug resistance transporter